MCHVLCVDSVDLRVFREVFMSSSLMWTHEKGRTHFGLRNKPEVLGLNRYECTIK